MISWPGENPAPHVTVAAYLEANKDYELPILVQEAQDMLDFYSGKNQWPKEILEKRLSMGRPTFVVNQLPVIASSLLSASKQAHHAVIPTDHQLMLYVIVHNNRDAQKIYNYMASAMAEEKSLPKPLMTYNAASVDVVDGVVHVKPPRFMHRSWLVRLLDRITRWIDPKA